MFIFTDSTLLCRTEEGDEEVDRGPNVLSRTGGPKRPGELQLHP